MAYLIRSSILHCVGVECDAAPQLVGGCLVNVYLKRTTLCAVSDIQVFVGKRTAVVRRLGRRGSVHLHTPRAFAGPDDIDAACLERHS